jgi:hypothetical protein
MPQLIQEHAAKLRERSGSLWAITIITPGVGSSGTYTEEVLARDAAAAFPKGTKLWFGHPKDDEGPGDRDARDQWGVLERDAQFDAESGGVISEVRVLDHWAPVVNSLGEQADLSIYAWADRDEEGFITALLPHRTNSIDIVSYPGRAGSGLDRKIEAAREAAPKPGVTSASQEKENAHMDEKILAAIEALTASLVPVVAFVNESTANKAADAQAKVDAEALESAAKSAVGSYKVSVEKIDGAELLAPIAEGLKARAEKGEEITESIIADAKKNSDALVEAAREHLEESQDETGFAGRVAEGAAKDAASLVPMGW